MTRLALRYGLLLIVLLMAATSCGSEASGAKPAVTRYLPPAESLGLPAPELLDSLSSRRTSEDPAFATTLDANAFLLASPEVVADEAASTAELNSAAGSLVWAIYRFGPLEPSTLIGGVRALYSSVDTAPAFIALGNYGTGRWDVHEAEAGSLGPLVSASISGDPLADYVSPAGNVYVAVLHWNGKAGLLLHVFLGTGIVFDPVENFAASRGSLIDSVELSWSAFNGAAGYVVGVRELGSEAEFTTLVETDGDATGFLHGPGSPAGMEPAKNTEYEYFVQAVLDSGLRSAAAFADGYAGLGVPEDFYAGYHAQQGRTLLRWKKVPGATGYNIYRSDSVTPLAMLGDEIFFSDNLQPDGDEFADYSYTLLATDADGEALHGAQTVGARLNLTEFPLAMDAPYKGNLAGALFDGKPVFLDTESDAQQALSIRSRVSHPDGPEDFDTYQLDSSGADNEFNALAIVDGFPALVYHDSDHDLLRYGYASVPDPNAAEDWTIANCLADISLDDFALMEAGGRPAIACLDSENFDLIYLYPDDSTPQGPQDWNRTVVDPAAGFQAEQISMAVADGLPVLTYVRADNKLVLARAANALPEGSQDWQISPVADAGFGGESALAYIDGRPAIAFQVLSESLVILCFAQAATANPQAEADWLVSSVSGLAGAASGEGLQLLSPGGLPLIVHAEVYSGTENSYAVTTHKACRPDPQNVLDWDHQLIGISSGLSDGTHSAVLLEDGRLGIMYGVFDEESFTFDMRWAAQQLP